MTRRHRLDGKFWEVLKYFEPLNITIATTW